MEAASEPCEGALSPRLRAWLTEKSIRRQVGGAQGTQQSHSLARARGAGARGRREEGERGGRGFLPHSPRQQGPIGRCRLRLATGHQSWIELLMSPSAAGEVCAWLGYLQAILGGSSCPAPGLGGRSLRTAAPGKREKESVRAHRAAPCWARGGQHRAPHPPRSAPRAVHPLASRAPETLAHGQSADRGGPRRPDSGVVPPGPRPQLTGHHRNRRGGSPTWPH